MLAPIVSFAGAFNDHIKTTEEFRAIGRANVPRLRLPHEMDMHLDLNTFDGTPVLIFHPENDELTLMSTLMVWRLSNHFDICLNLTIALLLIIQTGTRGNSFLIPQDQTSFHTWYPQRL
jgi:hypothetical protein